MYGGKKIKEREKQRKRVRKSATERTESWHDSSFYPCSENMFIGAEGRQNNNKKNDNDNNNNNEKENNNSPSICGVGDEFDMSESVSVAYLMTTKVRFGFP